MSYETEEQQIERLKEWWSDNGTPLVVGAVLGLAGFGGWKYWNQQQVAYQEAASDAYVKVLDVAGTPEKTGLAESAESVIADYPDSTYSILASFQLAKQAVEAKDLDKAVAKLTWVIDNHADNELTAIAKIRLARVFMEQDKVDQALPLVEISEESGYYALASLVKGDLLYSLDRKTEALAAYEAAKTDAEIVARHPTLQLKIDALSDLAPAEEVTEEAK